MASIMRTGASLLLALLAGCVAFAAAQETPQTHPLTNLPPAGEISTGFFFPDFPTRQFIAGQPVKVVLGVRNEASEAYNVSAIMGSLNNAADFSAYYWNFTQQIYFQAVAPSEELSVEYSFLPPKDLPPNDYQVALTVFYQDAQGFKSTTFFNQTVSINEKPQLIDWKLIFLYVIFIGLVFAGVYSVWNNVKESQLYKTTVGKKARKVEVSRADNADEWVKGTPYDNWRKASGKGKGASKKAQ